MVFITKENNMFGFVLVICSYVFRSFNLCFYLYIFFNFQEKNLAESHWEMFWFGFVANSGGFATFPASASGVAAAPLELASETAHKGRTNSKHVAYLCIKHKEISFGCFWSDVRNTTPDVLPQRCCVNPV